MQLGLDDPEFLGAGKGGGRIIDRAVDNLAHTVEPNGGAAVPALAAGDGAADGLSRETEF